MEEGRGIYWHLLHGMLAQRLRHNFPIFSNFPLTMKILMNETDRQKIRQH